MREGPNKFFGLCFSPVQGVLFHHCGSERSLFLNGSHILNLEDALIKPVSHPTCIRTES